MTLTGDEVERRRRATPQSVVANRAATAIVRSLRPEIARLQERAAFLLGLCRSEGAGRCNLELVDAEARALQAAIQAYSAQLAGRLVTLPEGVRNHGRILDAVRALRSAHSILQQARDQIGRVRRHERDEIYRLQLPF